MVTAIKITKSNLRWRGIKEHNNYLQLFTSIMKIGMWLGAFLDEVFNLQQCELIQPNTVL
jgi:hypothetical protein